MKKIQKKQPLVSVLMPVFNAAKFVEEAIKSVLAQTYTNFELIVIDDGSTDGSWKILQKLAKTDKRMRIYQNEKNSGIGYTRKRLANLAKGRFAAIMDADDIMFPNRLAIQAEYLQKNPKTVVVGGQCVTIDEEGKETGVKRFPTTHRVKSPFLATRSEVVVLHR